MDAKYVIVDSNMTHTGTPLPPCRMDYADVYLIVLR